MNEPILNEEQIAAKWLPLLEALCCELTVQLPGLEGAMLLELLDHIDAERHGPCEVCGEPTPLTAVCECGASPEDVRIGTAKQSMCEMLDDYLCRSSTGE